MSPDQLFRISHVYIWRLQNIYIYVYFILGACRNGCLESVRFLTHFKPGVDCNHHDRKGYRCTTLAAYHNQFEVIQFLCQVHNPDDEFGVDINHRNLLDNESALHVAARCDCRESIRSLLEMIPCHCDISARNYDGLTALHVAAKEGNLGAVKEFIRSLSKDVAADLDTKDHCGLTPMFHGEPTFGRLRI